MQAAFFPAIGTLFLWRSEGPAYGTDVMDLMLGGVQVRTTGRSLPTSAAIPLLQRVGPDLSPTVTGYSALLRLARALLQRGSLRPAATESHESVTLGWKATLSGEERALLSEIVATLPPAAFAGAPANGSAWQVARAFVDATLDTLVRMARQRTTIPVQTWEGAVEHGLIDRAPEGARTSRSLRVRRAMQEWERIVRERETPRARLVLRLDAPDRQGEPFPLSFAVEVRDPLAGILGPVKTAEVWAETPEAHRLVDDLPQLKINLRHLLHKAGGVFAPIEASLASGAPVAARLSGSEAWSALTRHRTELEAAGCRLVTAPALEGIADRFPRPRVRLIRLDNVPPESVTLAPRYRVEWEIVTDEHALTPAELRAAAKHEPVSLVRGSWIPMTAEAGERLARVAEREPAIWSGPQALAAALAGEVRLPGDLSDAVVIPEQGLAQLLVELKEEVKEHAQSPDLQATLRHYQSRGVGWLFHRTRLGLGALLADDMGLGKTVQLIALLLLLRDAEKDRVQTGPTLLICPASLVGNWERELARFAPSLRVVRHHGSERHRDAAQLQKLAGPHDVVLTTYSLARRDAEVLARVPWGTVVCDEAQNIKNPGSAQARGVRSLPAHRRVALSGTPVENQLTELWGLLEFLNPGLLGPLERFRREIANPLERDRDARALRWLRAATTPFMLRRLKSDPAIAPELPEKEIIRVFCSLTEEQAQLYQVAVEKSLNAIDESTGIERSGRVLRLLTELKQICNHPSQYLGDAQPLTGRSGKLDRAAEMLDEIVASGERALVFTQYVEMGERLCGYLQERLGFEVPFFQGSLSLQARDAMVKRFQDAPDGPPILVLSLRAGGVGLNLTRASHVLHFDRWWNPAIEDQATDRAHRIGQKQRVQVHHLITIGTLEEKIDRMLEGKRGLADAVITGGEAWLTQLSTDELRALVSLGSDAAVESLESLDA